MRPQTQNITNEQIIDYLAAGDAVKEIAEKSGMRVRGVEKRIACMRKKYNARSITQLVCIMKGLVLVHGNR